MLSKSPVTSNSKKVLANAESSRDFHVIVMKVYPNMGMHFGVKKLLSSMEEDA